MKQVKTCSLGNLWTQLLMSWHDVPLLKVLGLFLYTLWIRSQFIIMTYSSFCPVLIFHQIHTFWKFLLLSYHYTFTYCYFCIEIFIWLSLVPLLCIYFLVLDTTKFKPKYWLLSLVWNFNTGQWHGNHHFVLLVFCISLYSWLNCSLIEDKCYILYTAVYIPSSAMANTQEKLDSFFLNSGIERGKKK